MYHYLKWAALSLFVKRNIQYIVIILASLLIIHILDSIYEDIVNYLITVDRKDAILGILIGKWFLKLLLSAIVVVSVMKLGTGSTVYNRAKKRRKRKRDEADDAIMKRLERFKYKDNLISKSEKLINQKRKEMKEGQQ